MNDDIIDIHLHFGTPKGEGWTSCLPAIAADPMNIANQAEEKEELGRIRTKGVTDFRARTG